LLDPISYYLLMNRIFFRVKKKPFDVPLTRSGEVLTIPGVLPKHVPKAS